MRSAQQADIPGPLRVSHGLQHAAQRRVRAAHAGVGVAVTGAGYGHVHGKHQGRAAGSLGSLQGVLHEAAVFQHVELEPHRPVDGRRHFLDRAHRHGGQGKGNTLGRCRLGGLHLATAGEHPGQADRRQADRHRHLLAEQLGGQVQFGHVLQHALAQFDIRQVGDVAAQGVLGVGAAIGVVEQEGRQLALSRSAIVGGGRNDHGLILLLKRGSVA